MNTQTAQWCRNLMNQSVDQVAIDGIIATITCLCEERARSGETFCDIPTDDENRFMLIDKKFHDSNAKNQAVILGLKALGFGVQCSALNLRITW